MKLENFWNDQMVQEMNPSEKLFYIYLLTSPARKERNRISRQYEISISEISRHTGFSPEVIQVLLRRFENEYYLISYENNTLKLGGLHG